MQLTTQDIAIIIKGKIEGDPNAIVKNIAKIEEADDYDLCFLANPKYLHYIYHTKATAIIVNDNFVPEKPLPDNLTLIKVADAYSAFATLLEAYTQVNKINNPIGIEQPSYIHSTAKIGNDVYIGAFSYIGANSEIGNKVQIFPNSYIGNNVKIDDNSIVYAGVKIYQDCQIGQSVTIHSGAVIGADGFGFAAQVDGSYKKIPQTGNVKIDDFVEIGANTTIDRATLGSTHIRNGVKIDNLVQIAHNAEIGAGTAIAAQAGISGSTKIGSQCLIGGQAGIVGHISLADKSRVNAQSGVSKSIVQPGKAVTGSPAFEYGAALKSQALFKKLPEIVERIRKLEKKS